LMNIYALSWCPSAHPIIISNPPEAHTLDETHQKHQKSDLLLVIQEQG
jgi:hypothetical protein